ncbi:hypothetical protein [Nesterenkonia sp.]|uniref:hypothetical protein n=1 Tax=Nesterenkonia sp. TaxID=704201 RepID=UPI00261DF749|nr:hypothetical protein [Nesterenkonia sp.]
MPKLPPEDQLAPAHDLGGEPTEEDLPAPDLDDYDTDPTPGQDHDIDIEHVAVPETDEEPPR